MVELSQAEAMALMAQAQQAAHKAYAPYSDFPVGAALLDVDGNIHLGANIENASYGLTNCAERVAIAQALMSGSLRWKAIAVWAEKRPHGAITPCGACRQVLSEFAQPDSQVIFTQEADGQLERVSMQALLPAGFSGSFC